MLNAVECISLKKKKKKKNIVNLILLILNLETPLTYLTL